MGWKAQYHQDLGKSLVEVSVEWKGDLIDSFIIIENVESCHLESLFISLAHGRFEQNFR